MKILLIAALIVACPLSAWAQAKTKGDDGSVPVTTLFKDYHANEVAADQKYKGKRLVYSGQISGIKKGAFGEIYIELRTPNQFMSAHAYLIKEQEAIAASLAKGQKVRWECKGDGLLIGSPMLKDCKPA